MSASDDYGSERMYFRSLSLQEKYEYLAEHDWDIDLRHEDSLLEYISTLLNENEVMRGLHIATCMYKDYSKIGIYYYDERHPNFESVYAFNEDIAMDIFDEYYNQ